MAVARRRARTIEPDYIEDIADVIENDNSKSSEELASTLEELRGLSGSAVNIIIYKIDRMRGKWQYVKEIQPPIDTVELMEELRRDWGAANYGLRVMVNGKLSTTKHISIAEPKERKSISEGFGGSDMVQLMLRQSDTARAEQGQMFQLMLTMMQSSSQQMMASQQQSTQMMVGLMTAMMSGKENASDLLSKMVGIQKELNPDKTTSMTDTIEMLKAVKDMMPDGPGNEDFLSTALKNAPALMEAIGKIAPGRGPMALPSAQFAAAPVAPPPMDLSRLGDGRTLDAGTGPVNLAATEPVYKPNRVLDLIREDVRFYFRRGLPVELAADGLLEILERNGIQQADVLSLATELQATTNWLDSLAEYGIDLRSNPEWAEQLLAIVVEAYLSAGTGGSDPASGGDGRGETDASDHGELGA